MRALFLSPSVPFPPQNGGQHRSLGLIQALARFASVDVLAVGVPDQPRVAEARDHLRTLGASLEVYQPTGPGPTEDDPEAGDRPPDAAAHFRCPALAAELRRRSEGTAYDVVHVEELVMAQYAHAPAWPRVIDRQKVDWAYHADMARVVEAGSDAHLLEAGRFLWWERRLAGSFARVLVPGEGDRRLLEPIHGPGSVSVVPIAIADELGPPAAGPRRVDHALLYGALDYGPNIEAQRWFFQEAWPRLRAASSTLGTRVVGSGRPPLLAEPAPRDPRVEVLGFVPDVRTVLQAPGALVVGVRVGGGVRTKVLEALACGMPVVSTATGVENLDLVPGRDFLLAETATELVDALLRLERDPELVAALGREGPKRAEPYRWSRIEPAVEAVFREVLAGAGSRGPRAAAPAPAAAESSETARIAAELEALRRRRRGPARSLQRLARRLRRWPPLAHTEGRALRLLDRILAPSARGHREDRSRRGLARVLRALRRGPRA